MADRTALLGEPLPPRPKPVRAPAKTAAPAESGFLLGMALAPAIVGFVALVVSLVPMLAGTGNVPRGLIFLIVMQAGVIGLFRMAEDHPLLDSWTSTLICSAVLVPLLALQVALLREPYVSLERSSASPAIVATTVVIMVLLVGAIWAVWTSWDHPDEAGLLFMPQAMAVPALIGMRSTINQRPALQMLAEVMVLAALATGAAWLLPAVHRMLVPPVGVATLFVVLWATGHGPWFHATSGGIVRVLYSAMLAAAVVLVVAVPFVALWVQNGAKSRSGQPRRTRLAPAPAPATSPTAPVVTAARAGSPRSRGRATR